MKRYAGLLSLVALALVFGCRPEAPDRFEVPGTDEPVTDTGYVGSWTRGNDVNRTVVMIFDDGQGYRFRWEARSTVTDWRVECDWEGVCEEFEGGRKVADITLRVVEHPPSGHLTVEKTNVPVENPQNVYVFVDEWVLAPDGLSLQFRALRRGDEVFDRDDPNRPRGRLTKVSDRVADPPGGSTS